MQRKLPECQKTSIFNLVQQLALLPQYILRSKLKIKSRKPKENSKPSRYDFYFQMLLTYLGSFWGISVLAYLSLHSGYPLIAAPFGATAVLVFALPDSPLAQPRNVIGGNCLSAIICVAFGQLLGSEPWVVALAVATAIKLMQLTQTLHPPGGAIALLGVSSHASWSFVWTPVLVGSLLMVLCTVVFSRLAPGRTYPKRWL
jgi:CBS-domain-containing membrane protein